MRKGKKKVIAVQKSIFEHDKELRLQAIEIAKNHQETKPIKYLLKR